MNAYGLPTGARSGARFRTVPGGLLPACLAALALLVAELAGIRWGLGVPGLGAIREINDEVVAATATPLLQAILLATAAGTYLAVSSDDRRDGVLTDASQRAVAVTVLICVVLLPLLAGRSLLGVPRSANLLLLVLAAEIAVGAGVGIGYAAVRRSALAPLIVVGVLALLFSMVARTILTQALLSDVTVTASQIGLADAARAAAELRDWTPRAHGIATALAVVATVPFLPARGARALVAAAVAPLVVTAAVLPLALFSAGGAATEPYGAGFWLWTLAGAATGYALALLLVIVLKRGWSR